MDEASELAKTVYTITNPVDSDLVLAAHHWPGLVSLPSDVGRTMVFKRPRGYFSDNGPLPESAALALTALPSLAHLEHGAYVSRLASAVASREEELVAARRTAGRALLGRRAIRDQSHLDAPTTHEPRRKLSPRVACRDKWARIEALQRLREFLEAYREAWERWRQGARDVLFPYGTSALRVHAGVRCLGPP